MSDNFDSGAAPQVESVAQIAHGEEQQLQSNPDGSGGRGGERKGPPQIDHLISVKVDNLAYDTQRSDIESTFGKYGNIEDVSC